ncbi:hypothetical protein RRG08_032979 [Elysia crispata]|uniref:Uncharacterized protein n=1 Tax=Elysia crispata TaxID=231223 RepID=A0AAE0YT75_9GAST|nr:hypothetical protein RRG08_032979 [Elysia crispata]
MLIKTLCLNRPDVYLEGALFLHRTIQRLEQAIYGKLCGSLRPISRWFSIHIMKRRRGAPRTLYRSRREARPRAGEPVFPPQGQARL